MNFDDWINTYIDDEKDTLCLMDAWRAGGMAMFDYLTDLMDELSEDSYKNLKEEVEALMEGKE